MSDVSSDMQIEYDVERRVLKSLKKRDGVATAGDVVADTGLGYGRVEQALRHMLTLYKSHLDVDDEGNLRYRFDPSFARRGARPGRLWHNIKKGAWTAFVAFFKVWTMVMLVGYTILFLLLLIAVGIAGFAMSMQGDNRQGGRVGLLPFLLVVRFLEFMFWWNILSGGSRRGRRRRSSMGGYRRKGIFGMFDRRSRRKEKPEKPFYQRVFDYLFGPEAPETDPLGPEKAFARFVRARGGRITAAEWASRTGQTLQEAENALTASVVRFNGDVEVTDDGVLVYRFDELMVTAEGTDDHRELPPIWERAVQVAPFTGNPKSSNTWITLLNGFNLVMAAFVLFAVVGLPVGAQIGLGWVPLVFSSLFFAVPAIRKVVHDRKKERAERENTKRRALEIVFESAREGAARKVPDSAIPQAFRDDFLLGYDGDIEVTDEGITAYRFPTVAEQLGAGDKARQSSADEVVFGQTIFSSDEDEKSLEEAEMEEFDRRLARELGGEVFESEQTPAVEVSQAS